MDRTNRFLFLVCAILSMSEVVLLAQILWTGQAVGALQIGSIIIPPDFFVPLFALSFFILQRGMWVWRRYGMQYGALDFLISIAPLAVIALAAVSIWASNIFGVEKWFGKAVANSLTLEVAFWFMLETIFDIWAHFSKEDQVTQMSQDTSPSPQTNAPSLPQVYTDGGSGSGQLPARASSSEGVQIRVCVNINPKEGDDVRIEQGHTDTGADYIKINM